MARPMIWLETNIAFAAKTDQSGTPIVTTADMDEISAGTIERIILSRSYKTGSTAQNVITEGIIVTDPEASSPDFPDPKDATLANAGWMNKTFWGFNVANQTTDGMSQKMVLDLRVRRKIKRGQVCVIVLDDTAGDYDIIYMRARVLIRLS